MAADGQPAQEEPYLHNYYRDLFNNLRQYSDQTKGWWALNLLASPNSGPPPTPEEVLDMASYLGIAPRKEYHLMWVAKQAVQVALPPNWEELEDNEGNVYFYDKATGKSSIKHPMDDYFFALVQVWGSVGGGGTGVLGVVGAQTGQRGYEEEACGDWGAGDEGREPERARAKDEGQVAA